MHAGEPKLHRHRIIAHLCERLGADPLVRAATLGGSDATGRADERSDVDVFVLVEPGAIEHTAALFEHALLELSPLNVRYRLPMPTWHGFHQAFYQLARASEDHMVDWVIVETRPETWRIWFEQERHGRHKVLFDKDSLIRAGHVDRAEVARAIAKKVPELEMRFRAFRHLPVKLVDRGLPVDAAYFYHQLILRPLVDMLRIVHCPDRYDFGFRYVKFDLPGDSYRELERLMYPSGAAAIPGLVARADELFARALAEYRNASSPGLPSAHE